MLKEWLIIKLGYIYLWIVGKTSKVREVNDIEFDKLNKSGKNFIYAFWHGRQLFLVYSHRFKNICILISQSRDGECPALAYSMARVSG